MTPLGNICFPIISHQPEWLGFTSRQERIRKNRYKLNGGVGSTSWMPQVGHHPEYMRRSMAIGPSADLTSLVSWFNGASLLAASQEDFISPEGILGNGRWRMWSSGRWSARFTYPSHVEDVLGGRQSVAMAAKRIREYLSVESPHLLKTLRPVFKLFFFPRFFLGQTTLAFSEQRRNGSVHRFKPQFILQP